jgi:hypothetical protein
MLLLPDWFAAPPKIGISAINSWPLLVAISRLEHILATRFHGPTYSDIPLIPLLISKNLSLPTHVAVVLSGMTIIYCIF